MPELTDLLRGEEETVYVSNWISGNAIKQNEMWTCLVMRTHSKVQGLGCDRNETIWFATLDRGWSGKRWGEKRRNIGVDIFLTACFKQGAPHKSNERYVGRLEWGWHFVCCDWKWKETFVPVDVFVGSYGMFGGFSRWRIFPMWCLKLNKHQWQPHPQRLA